MMKQFDHMTERKLNLELSNVFPRLSNVFPRLKFLAGCGQFSDFSNTYHRIPNTPHLPLSYIPNCTRPLQDNPTHLILESDESSVSTSEGSDSSCEAMEGPHGDDDGLVITNSSTSEDL
jgi:hypothetical protein